VNPRGYMWLQAGALATALIAVGLSRTHVVGLLMTSLVATWWLVLNNQYARALGRRPRTTRRGIGDRHVTAQFALIALAGFSSGLAATVSRSACLITGGAARWVACATALLWALIWASSLVDWYWILPRVNGVVGEALCRASDDRRRVATRTWHLHRAIAHIGGCIAAPVALTALVAVAAPTIDTEGLAAVAAAISVPFAGLTVLGIGALGDLFVDGPDVWVGDMVRHGNSPAYVSLGGMRKLTIRDWNEKQRAWGRPRSVLPKDLEMEPDRTLPCLASCQVNEDCDWRRPKPVRGFARRLVI
jgi:hypothetical protein